MFTTFKCLGVSPVYEMALCEFNRVNGWREIEAQDCDQVNASSRVRINANAGPDEVCRLGRFHPWRMSVEHRCVSTILQQLERIENFNSFDAEFGSQDRPTCNWRATGTGEEARWNVFREIYNRRTALLQRAIKSKDKPGQTSCARLAGAGCIVPAFAAILRRLARAINGLPNREWEPAT